MWAIRRKQEKGGEFLAVNAGRDEGNYQVRELAEAVAQQTPGAKVSINTNAPPDKRSYRVDFSLFRSLAPDSFRNCRWISPSPACARGWGPWALRTRISAARPLCGSRPSSATWPRAVSVRICAGASVRTTWKPTPASFHRTPLEGAYRIELDKRGDDPGFFARVFCENEFRAADLDSPCRDSEPADCLCPNSV